MSQHLDSLSLGDTIEVKGPLGHFVYEGRGTYSLNGKKGARSKHALLSPASALLRTRFCGGSSRA